MGLSLSARCAEVVRIQREGGRSALADDERASLARLHDDFPAGNSDTGEVDEDEILRLMTRPFSRVLNIPEYYQYTCMHVYHWFLAGLTSDVVAGAFVALHVTLADLVAAERAIWPGARPAYVDERIAGLDGLIADLAGMVIDPDGRQAGEAIRRAVTDPAEQWRMFVLARSTDFPRSEKAEERFFLRCVQACEVVFFLVRRLAVQAVAAADAGRRGRARFLLDLADRCADLLHRVFAVQKTMSPERFLSFREQAGAASAVQSLNYHAMELVIYGFDPRKAEVFDDLSHLKELGAPPLSDVESLPASMAATGDAELVHAYRALERTLARWRGLHYWFARTYLPADVKSSGGTAGAEYVKHFVKKSSCRSGATRAHQVELLGEFLYR